MAIFSYQANELFEWLSTKQDVFVLDVRNDKDFARFQVESPCSFEMLNVSYYDYMELEEESVAKVPKNRKIRIVCAKEGSAKYVAEILEKHGYEDVGYLAGGIKTWGNMLIPKILEKNESYELYQFIRPGKASCSYGLKSGDEMMIFDPSRNVDFYIQFAKRHNCKLIKTFETHLQADYISGSRVISQKSGAAFLGDGDFEGSNNPYIPLEDEETFHFSNNGPEVSVLFTPGHTPGSTSYMIDNKFMISGDMVFISSIGRPDLGGKAEEWAGMLFDSMQLVKKLNHNLVVLPGHYMNWEEANDDLAFVTTLGDAIERNKDIYNIDSEDGFVQFIKNNMRPQPEEYAVIRKVNANIEQVEDDRAEELDLGKNECAATAYAKAQEPK